MPKLVTTNMSINNGQVWKRYHHFSRYCLEARPDIIAVQEVSADVGFLALQLLAKNLGHDYQFWYEPVYPGQEDTQGLGVLTQLPVKASRIFDPEHGRNKFQILEMEANGNRQLTLANVHMEAHLFLDFMRRRKLKSLTAHLDPDNPQIIAGDFNAIPRLPSVRFISRQYRSAHVAVHGLEPSHTYPTDLGEDLLLNNGDASYRQILAMKLAARIFQVPQNRRPSGLPRMVVDYAFVNQFVQVHDVKTTGHDEARLNHSDHRGLEVDFSVN